MLTRHCKIAYTINLSQGRNNKENTISNFRTTSRILIYANALIFSCAIITALYGTLITLTTNTK